MPNLTPRDRAALAWLKGRCSQWRFRVMRRRKYSVPRGVGFDPEEAEILQALIDVERGAERLLKITTRQEVS